MFHIALFSMCHHGRIGWEGLQAVNTSCSHIFFSTLGNVLFSKLDLSLVIASMIFQRTLANFRARFNTTDATLEEYSVTK